MMNDTLSEYYQTKLLKLRSLNRMQFIFNLIKSSLLLSILNNFSPYNRLSHLQSHLKQSPIFYNILHTKLMYVKVGIHILYSIQTSTIKRIQRSLIARY